VASYVPFADASGTGAVSRPQVSPGLAPKYTGSGLADRALNDRLKQIGNSPAKGKTSKANTQGDKLAQAAAKKILSAPGATDEQKRQANEILNPKKVSPFASAVGSISNSFVGKAATGFLDAFDFGRAAIVSTVSESNDFLTDVFNLKGHEYVDASLGELVKQTRDNVGFGSVFREKAAAIAAAGGDGTWNTLGVKVFKDADILKNAPKGSKAFKEFLKEGTKATQADVSAGKAKKVGDNLLDYTTGGKILGIGIGITGDIALDPLTYLGMGGTRLAGMSAEALAAEVAELGLKNVAAKLDPTVFNAIGQKIATKGKWSLNAKELEAIGYAGEGGIHFRVPGTGVIGRNTVGLIGKNKRIAADVADNVAAGMTKDAAQAAAKETAREGLRTGAIKGSENLMRYTPVGLYTSRRAATRGYLSETNLIKNFGGKASVLKDKMHNGTPAEFAEAFHTILSGRVGHGRQQQFNNELKKMFYGLDARAQKLRIASEDIYDMLGDPTNATPASQRIYNLGADAQQLMLDYREFATDVLPKSVNAHAGEQLIDPLRLTDDWQPSIRPKETYEWLKLNWGKKSDPNAKFPFSDPDAERFRHIAPGQKFMGEMLYSAEDSVGRFGGNTNALTAREQAMYILERNERALGQPNVKAMFERDISKAMPAQIDQLSNRVYASVVQQELIRRGVATKLTRNVTDLEMMADKATIIGVKVQLANERLQLRMAGQKLADARQAVSDTAERLRNRQTRSVKREARRDRKLATMTAQADAAMEAETTLMDEAVTSAERLSANLAEHRAATAAHYEGMKNLDYLNTPEYAAASARVAAVAGEMDKSYEGMGRLVRMRNELVHAVAVAEEAAERGSKSALNNATRNQLFERIDLLEGAIADLHGVHVSSLMETHAVASETLANLDELPKQMIAAQGLFRDLAAAEAAGDSNAAAVIASQLKNNFWTDLSGATPEQFTVLKREVRAMTQPLRDHVAAIDNARNMVDQLGATNESLTRLGQQASDLGNLSQAEAILRLQQALPVNEGTALVNPLSEDGVWHFGGTQGEQTVFSPSGFRSGPSAVENGLGFKLTQQAGNDTAEVVVKVTNPKVYELGETLDMAYAHRQFNAYGSHAPNAVRELRNDMLEEAWRSGTLTPEMMGPYRAQWNKVRAEMKRGSSFRAALQTAFGEGAEGKFGLKARSFDFDGVGDAEWLHSQMADRLLGDLGTLPADVKSKIALNFRESIGRNHDAIILPGARDEWQVIVLHPETLNTTGGQAIEKLDEAQAFGDALQNQLFKNVDAVNATNEFYGTNLSLAEGNYRDIQHRFIDNLAARDEIAARLRSAPEGKLRDALEFEDGLRAEVERLATAASGHRAKIDSLRDEIKNAVDDADFARLVEEEEIEGIKALLSEQKGAATLLEADLAKRSAQANATEQAIKKYEGQLVVRGNKNYASTNNRNLKSVTDVMTQQLARDMQMLSNDVYAPNYIVQAIIGMRDITGEANGLTKLLGSVDKVTNLWKAQAMLRPGFHSRNFMGGAINNSIGHVRLSSYRDFHKSFKVYRAAALTGTHAEALNAVRLATGPEAATKIDQLVMGAVLNGGQSTAESALIGGTQGGNFNPLSQKFKLYKLNARKTADVENILRGAMGWDRLSKGLGVDAALADVARYHFDYDDLSVLERSVIRRIVPFYTWTRKNLPLQIEMMLENPKVMLRYANAKKSIEETSPDEDVYPDWFNNALSIRTPFKGQSGSSVYYQVDAPFKDIGGLANPATAPGKLLEMANPLFKTPIELKMGKKAFGGIPFKEGYQPVPSIWEAFGVPEVMSAFGKASKDNQGNWVMRDKDLYLVEQWMPMLANARRLLPMVEDSVNPKTGVKNVDKYEDRVVYSWASFMFGQVGKTNTATDQNNEMVRRSVELKKLTTDLKTKGYIPSGTKQQQLQAQRAE